MFRAILPWAEALIILLTWWLFFGQQRALVWFVGIGVVTLIVTARFIARAAFFRFYLSWINIIFIYLTQTLFLVLLRSDQWRYWLAFLFSILWALIWWSWRKYFAAQSQLLQADYLSFNKFWYYLNFWFLASSIYALLLFINLPLLVGLGAILVVATTMIIDLLRWHRLFNIWLLLVWFLLMAQILAAIYWLPINFFLAGTLAVVWFYFLTENWLDPARRLRLNLGLLLVANLLVLLLIFLTL